MMLTVHKIKHLSLYLIGSIVSVVIGLLVNPFLALGLNHEDYAIIGYFASLGTLLSPIIAFCFNSYYASRFFLLNEKQRENTLQTLLTLFLLLGLCVFFIFLFFYYLYHKYYVSSIPFSPYAVLSFLPMFFSSFYNIYLLDLRMRNKSSKYAVLIILQALLGALLSFLLVYIISYGAIGRLLALLIVSILFAVYSLLIKKFRFNFDLKIAKEAFIFCWPLTISAVLSFFFMGIDRPLLVELNDNYTLGLYNVGLQISSYLYIFSIVLMQTFDPDIYKYTSLRQHRKVLLLLLGILLLCIVPNIIFILISKTVISVLTYGRYVDASLFANILCLKNISSTFAFLMSGVLIGYGYSRCELLNRVIGSVVAFVLYKYLILNWGFYGAAWGQFFSWLIMGGISVICLLLVYKRNGRAKCDNSSI